MSRLFLSHSSANNAEAVALRDWLADAGWNEVFLDLDPEQGISAGERWERALNEAASRCEAVLFLISQNWLDSRWCLKEFNLARKLNKRLFGVLIDAIPVEKLPADLTGAWQVVDLASGQDHAMFHVVLPRTHEEAHVTFSKEGLARLRNGLAKAGLDPRFFAWPPEHDADRPPYRGLKPLEAEDAGIFFGRDAPIVEALDTLRGLREGAAPRLLVILGASGAGKSSFLRAGLLPRLMRDDRNFLPLPIIRPERAAISGETGLLHAVETALAAHGLSQSRASLREAIAGGAEKLRPLLARLADKVFATMLAGESEAKRPVIVLAIDQAEELFLGEGAKEGEALLELVRDLVKDDRPGIVALFTIRSDSYDRMETAKAIEGVRQQTLPLLPMPRGAYQTVIEGPAARLKDTDRTLVIEPRLTQRLLEDVEKGGGSDALPLLAFTLEQLYLDYGGGGALKLADYDTFGGIRGAIEAAVARALAAADGDARIPRDREARLALLRRGLIPWLAGIDTETGSPRRRVARLADIPEEAAPLINLLVEQRLLATDRIAGDDGEMGKGEITIEPAHEALLRQWGLLRGWLDDDFAALTTLEGVKRAARDWAANARREDWLNHTGGRLEEAEKVAARDDLAGDLSTDAGDYLRHCRSKQEAERRREELRLKADAEAARERAEAALRLARRTRAAAIVVSVLLVIAVGVGVYALQQSRLAAEQEGLAQARAQDAEKAERTAKGELAKTQIAQSRFLADQAEQRSVAGDDGTALALALEALPTNIDEPDRPYVMVAYSALFQAMAHLRERLLLIGHESMVSSAAYSADGTRVITSSNDKTARIWDASTGKLLVLLQDGAALNDAALSPDGGRAVTAATNGVARIWDTASGREIVALSGHASSILTARFNFDGTRVVTASKDGSARVWNAATGNAIAVIRGPEEPINSAAFSPDGTRVVTPCADKNARVWDAITGKELLVLRGHEREITAALFSPDGARLLTASFDKSVRIWDAGTGKELAALHHDESVYRAAYSRDGKRIVAAPYDGTIRIWDAAAGKEAMILRGHDESVAVSVDFDRDGKHVVTGSEEGTARIWDVSDDKAVLILRGHQGWAVSAAFSPDGKRVVSASFDTTARIWNVATGKEMMVLRGHESGLSTAAFSSDGKRVVTGSADRTARIWDAIRGIELVRLRGHDAQVLSASFNHDDTRVVTASLDRTARIWDVKTGKEIMALRGHADQVVSAAYSPNDKFVATSSRDKTIRIWDAATGTLVTTLRGHSAEVVSVAFSPDGTRLVTASSDRTARVWDVVSGQEIRVLKGAQNLLESAAFSPDGTRVVAASVDKTALIWDVDSSERIMVLRGHSDRVWSAAFSPDGTQVVTASFDGTLRLWPVPGNATQAFVAEARQAAPRCLTPDDRLLFFLQPDPPAWCTEDRKWPYDPASIDILAQDLYRARKYDQAIARFTEALRLDPSLVAAYVGRGDAYYDIDRYDEAIADYTQAIALDPKFARAYVERGDAYREKKEFELAIGDYSAAIRLDPKFARAYNNRGNVYSDKKDYDRAIADYDQAIALDAKYVAAYVSRGNAYRRKGDPDRAIADYDKAIGLDPLYARAYKGRGDAYYDKKDYQRAIADRSRVIALDPRDAGAWNSRCWDRAMIGQLQAALEDCNESLRLRPNDADALDSRGFVNLKMGRLADAIADYDAALRLEPRKPESLYGRGMARLRKGDTAAGNEDIAAAKAVRADIAEEFARYGI